MQWACLAFSLDREKAVKQLALHTETSTLQEELVKKNHCKIISYAVVIYFHRMMCNMKLNVRKPTYLLKYQIEVGNTAILISVVLQQKLVVLVCYKRQLNIDRTGEH